MDPGSFVKKGYSLGEYHFTIASSIDEIASSFDALLDPSGPTPGIRRPVYYVLEGPGGSASFIAYRDSLLVGESSTVGGMTETLLFHIERDAIDFVTDRYVAVHAAVAEYGGVAVVFPGRSGSGKTTLMAALSTAGFACMSDEVALIAPDGRVHPFTRPLRMEPSTVRLFEGLRGPGRSTRVGARYTFVAPRDLAGVRSMPAPIRHVVLPRFDPGAETELRPISAVDALMTLGEQSFNLTEAGTAGFRTLSDVARNAGCFALTIGSGTVEAAVGLMTDLFAPPLVAHHAGAR